MANIETNLYTIATGRYGKDVREAIHDAIAEIHFGNGETITGKSPLENSIAGLISGIKVKGKSSQAAAPEIDNPAEIVDANKLITAYNKDKSKSNSITPDYILRSAGEASDEIVIDPETHNGTYTQYIRPIKVTGAASEVWHEVNVTPKVNQMFAFDLDVILDITKPGISNRFIHSYETTTPLTSGSFFRVVSEAIWFVFPLNTFVDLADFKGWLKNHETIVYAVLKSPLSQTLTEQQKADILALEIYDEKTTIETELDVTVSYFTDIKTYVDRADAEINERIDELASNSSSLVLTNPSPLNNADGKKILGIDAVGRSWQDGTQKFTFTQGAIVPTVGSALNQDINANNSRCTSNIIQLPMGSVISAPSGYEIYLAHATTENGNIDIAQTWVTTYTTAVDGYWRVVCRNKNNTSANIVPSECNVTANASPTPSNPIPITDADPEVTAIGKNLFDKERCVNGYLDGNGNVVSNPQYRVSDYIEVEHSQITISGNKGGNEVICFFAEDKTRVSFFAMGSNNIKTLDVPQNAKFVRCTVSADNLNIYQVEIGATATSYVPYQSNSVSLPFEPKSVETAANELIVYEDGTGKIIKRVGEADLSTLDWEYESTNNRFLSSSLQNVIKKASARTMLMLSDIYTSITDGSSLSSTWNNCVYNGNNDGYVIVHDHRTTNVSTFKSNISGHILYYPLATPVEIPLTAEEVAAVRQLMTYKGTTTIESEMDVKSVTYSGDVKAYIDGFHTYSTVPTICGYEEDGTPRYTVKIYTTTPSTASTTTVVSTLINTIKYNVKKVDGTFSYDTTTAPINMFIDTSYNIATWVDQSGIKMRVGQARYANCACEIEVEYTLKDSAPAAASVLSLDEEGDE